MKKVLIVGGGEIGKAIKYALLPTSSEVVVWDKDPSRSEIEGALADALQDKDLVVGAVPSIALREVAGGMKETGSSAFFLSLTKGIDPSTSQFPYEVLDEILPGQYGLLCGPMIAEEIMAGKPAAAVLTSRAEVGEILHLFRESMVRVTFDEDVVGVSIVAVLKNMYSILLGVLDALELGANARGMLVTHILHEMAVVVAGLGGKKETAYSLAGIGDLVATGTSENSSNRSMGADIISKGVCSLESEGCRSLPLLESRVDYSKYPFLQATARVTQEPQEAQNTILSLL